MTNKLVEKLAEKLKKKDYLLAPVVSAAVWPFSTISSGIKSVTFGPEAKTGPMKGKRVKPIGITPIAAVEYKDLLRRAKHGVPAPQVGEVRAENGKRFYFKVQYGTGGAVGFAKRHPVLALTGAAGAALGASMLYGKVKQRALQGNTTNTTEGAQSSAWG